VIHRFRLLSLLAVVPAALTACGKKGPPLAPIRLVPAHVEDLVVRRYGSDVYLQFTIPNRNQDKSTPGDVAEMRAYGLTLKPETRRPEPPPLEIREFTKLANEIGRVEVQPPPVEEEKREDAREQGGGGAPPLKKDDAKARRTAEAAKKAAEAAADPRPAQGARVTIVETLTPETFTPVERPLKERRRARTIEQEDDDSPIAAPLFVPLAEDLPTRTYVVIGYNRKAQAGQPSARVLVPLVPPPVAPAAPRLSYDESAISLAWQRPAALRRRMQEPGEPGWDEVRPADGPIEPPLRYGVPLSISLGPPLAAKPIFADTVPAAYNVYEAPSDAKPESKPDAPPPLAGAAPAVDMPQPLNASPIESTRYQDQRVEFERERCYVIRTVETHGELKIESDPSPRACVTPRDIFPPPAPTNLAAVASEGGISLIWEGTKADDLAGYLVLRGEAPAGVPKPLTTEPVKETTFRDTAVRAGMRYSYVVVAVDTATPPNTSGQSNRVEETAR
jgi:hypothetical protein